MTDPTLRRLIITVGGNLAGGTYLLEASLDNGSTWFVVPALTSDITITGVADTAAVVANRYDVFRSCWRCSLQVRDDGLL